MRKTRETRLAPLLERTLKALKGQLSPHTLENYRNSISKVKRFEGDRWERLGVGDIDRRWSDRYALWLAKQHEKPQTADCYLRNFRAVYRHALAYLRKGADGKPFEGYRSRGSRPAKRALPKEEARRLLSPGLRERLSERLCEVLDILLFILYARGMAFNDVYELRWQMVADGHIRYRRSKTGVFIDVLVVPELERIMRRYRLKGSPYVFPFLHAARKGCREGELSERSALRRVNRAAHEIGRLAGLSLPLTTYVLRHTWATLMLEDGQPVELISQGLGHTSIRTTQIYLSRISVRKVDAAVSGMYDRLLRDDRSDIPPAPEPPKEVSDSAINEKCPFLGEKETSKKNPINIVHVSGRKSIHFTKFLQLFRDIFNRLLKVSL